MNSIGKMTSPRKVFVIHGRNHQIRNAMFQFLQALDLRPIEWEQARAETGQAAPYIGQILEVGFAMAQASIVLFTGDDEAKLREEFQVDGDRDYEKNYTPQPRQNVIFEAGMALALQPERTIIVEVGRIRPMSDLAGRHVVKLRSDDNGRSRQELRQMLQQAGCQIDDSGGNWLSAGDFY